MSSPAPATKFEQPETPDVSTTGAEDTGSSSEKTAAEPYKIIMTRVSKSPSPEPEASTSTTTTTATTDTPAEQPNPWQAIFSPQHGTYYFYNTVTNETTWINPIAPPTNSQSPPAEPEAGAANEKGKEKEQEKPAEYQPPHTAMYNAAVAAGIDPALAHLDPSLLHSLPGPSGTASSSSLPTFKATFNARTGRFTSSALDPNAGAQRTPAHLSEYERAKRMSEVYFDVNAWEGELETRRKQEMQEVQENGGEKKRKRPTKTDLERFKESKKAKKIAKTAWLRN